MPGPNSPILDLNMVHNNASSDLDVLADHTMWANSALLDRRPLAYAHGCGDF